MTIPARAHFCWIGTRLPWAYAFAVLSAAERSELPEIVLHHTDVLDVIERSQPYHSPDPDRHWLTVLNALVNRDKHRAVRTVAWVSEDFGIAYSEATVVDLDAPLGGRCFSRGGPALMAAARFE